jgi:hypothetical protein
MSGQGDDSDSYSDSDEASSRFHKSVLSSMQPKKRRSPIITQEGDFDSTMADTNNGLLIQQPQPQPTTTSTAVGVKRTRSLQSSNASASASSDKGTNIAAPASQLFARPLIRRRSSLFGDLPTGTRSRMNMDKSVSSFPQRLFSQEASQSTVLASENEESQQLPASKKPPAGSSLFGAVMRNFGSSSTGEGGSEASITSTPTKTRRDENNDGEQSNMIFSPKGNTIMNMVNKFVMSSPFRFQSPQKKAKRTLLSNTNTNSNSNSNPAPHTPSPRKKRRRLDMDVAAADSRSSLHDGDHWHQATFDTTQAQQQLTILDWSLKKQLKLECHPKDCLANITSSPQWDASLQYWQYPAAPMSSFLLLQQQQQQQQQQRLTTAKPMLDEKSTLPLSSSVTIANRLIEAVKTISPMGEGLDESSFLVSRQQEWQEALRSIYFKWHQQVQMYDSISKDDQQKPNSNSGTNCYFYCKGTNHVALFRVEYSADGRCKPFVILSGATSSFRQTLQDLGAERVDFLEAANENAHIDSSPLPSGKSKSSSLFPQCMSPTVKADLEALRQAQVYGQTAGADVTVKFKAKNNNNNNMAPEGSSSDNKSQKLPPLMIQGIDDVDLFFEVYLNSLGRVNDSSLKTTATSDNNNNDLPWILCRQVGPFAHASMKSLTFHPPTKHQKQQEKYNDDYATLEIHAGGCISAPILPCAIRELTSVLAKGMAADHAHVHAHAKRGDQHHHPSVTTKKEVTESSHHNHHHHWILQAIPDRPAVASIVGGGSGWFNRGGIKNEEDDDENDGDSVGRLEEECRHGQVLQLLAWDVAKKDAVTYKVDSSVPGR